MKIDDPLSESDRVDDDQKVVIDSFATSARLAAFGQTIAYQVLDLVRTHSETGIDYQVSLH